MAVAEASDLYADVHHVEDLPEPLLRHMEEFFQNYPRVLSDKEFKLLATEDPDSAKKLIEKARQTYESE